MKIDADVHNFGQQVTQMERASEIYFQKPRPIYWEWLFFGKNSPIKSVFESPNHLGNNIVEVLFNLDVQFENNDCGTSKKIIETDVSSNQASHAYSLGVLIAYCYVFGIRDLHKGNVIRTRSHLQVIDAEVVLAKILLPNETLLLPFKETTADICAARKFVDDITAIDIKILKLILSGYFDLFSILQKNHNSLIEIFNSHREKMLTVPIRHIMRDTMQYKKWLNSKAPLTVALSNNELKQLERGDIPYYFKFIGNSSLFAYTNPSGEYESVLAPGEFQKAVSRDATDPLELLTTARLDNDLLPTGALFILKKFLPKNFTGNIEGTNFKSEATAGQLEINFNGRFFTAKI